MSSNNFLLFPNGEPLKPRVKVKAVHVVLDLDVLPMHGSDQLRISVIRTEPEGHFDSNQAKHDINAAIRRAYDQIAERYTLP